MAKVAGTNVDAALIDELRPKGMGAYEWGQFITSTDNPNDALFDMAYWSIPGGAGTGKSIRWECSI